MFFLLFFAYLIQHFYLVRLLFCFLSNFTKLAQKLEKQKKMKFKAKNSLYWSIIGNAILVDFAKFMIRIEKGREKFKMTFIFIFLISLIFFKSLPLLVIFKAKSLLLAPYTLSLTTQHLQGLKNGSNLVKLFDVQFDPKFRFIKTKK